MNKNFDMKVLVEYREYENSYPENLIKELIFNGLCKVKKGKIKFTVSGILIYKNTFLVIFPKAYQVPLNDDNLIEHIKVFIEVLLKYREESHLESEELDLLGGDEGEYCEDFLTSYRLINDYMSNGPLIRKMYIKTSNLSGNTDWVDTINKKQPIFSGNSVLYHDTISRKATLDRQNQLLKIYHFCINKSIENYGWLIGINKTDINMNCSELPFDFDYAIKILKMELNNTFIDREIVTIKMMIDFLAGLELERPEATLETLVTPYFYNVWEAICGSIFKNQYNKVKKIIPKLNWVIESEAVIQPQRPDILFIHGNKLYILDAKYYDVTTNLPGWYDVVKQMFYAKTIFKNIKSEDFKLKENISLENKVKRITKVENLFLFPSPKEITLNAIGSVNIERNKDFDNIKAIQINTYQAMKSYIGKEDINFVKLLLNLLNETS